MSRTAALLLVLSGNMLIDALEVSTTVVAMPAIARDFTLSPAAASILMIAFAVGFGGSLIPVLRLTNRYGRRRAYLVAMAVFVGASVAAGLAPDVATLTATRLIKGVCVALTAPTGLGIIAATFPAGAARARAMSVYTLFGASGFSIGLVLSGLLTTVDWRWAMVASAPAALVLCPAAIVLIPPDTPTPAGSAEPAVASPWPLVRAAMCAAALNGCFWGFLVLVTFDLQDSARLAPWLTGLALLPASLPLTMATATMGPVVARIGPGRLILAGAAAAVLGYAFYFSRSDGGYAARVLPTALLIATAFVLSFAALNTQAVSGWPAWRQPAIGAGFQTCVQLGGAFVLTVLATAPSTAAPLLIAGTATSGLLFALPGAWPIRTHPKGHLWLPTRSE